MALSSLPGYGDGGRPPAPERPHRPSGAIMGSAAVCNAPDSRPAALGFGILRPGVEAAFGQRGRIRSLSADSDFAADVWARSCRPGSHSMSWARGCVLLRAAAIVESATRRSSPPCPASIRGSHTPAVARRGLCDRAWRLDASALLCRRTPAQARPRVSIDGVRNRRRSAGPEATLSHEQELEADRLARSVPESRCPRRDVLRDDQRLRSYSCRTFRRRNPVGAGTDHHRFEWIVLRNGPVSGRCAETARWSGR